MQALIDMILGSAYGQIVASLLGIAGGVLLVVSALSRGDNPIVPSRWRPLVALGLGMLGSVIVYGAELVALPGASPPWNWLAICLFGLIATAVAAYLHDLFGFKNVQRNGGSQ